MHKSYVSTYTHIEQFHPIRSPNRAIPLGFYVPSVSSCLNTPFPVKLYILHYIY